MVTAAFIDMSLIVSWDCAGLCFCFNQDYTFSPVSRCCLEKEGYEGIVLIGSNVSELTSIEHFPLSPSCGLFLFWLGLCGDSRLWLPRRASVLWSFHSFILWTWVLCPHCGGGSQNCSLWLETGKEPVWTDISLQNETIFIQLSLVVKGNEGCRRAYNISADGLVIQCFSKISVRHQWLLENE